ncbi:D-beta-D-heptose 7-phosphate kinase/D-beta-D-heptose 1-phosphate adenosyltransferase [Pedobacter sp. AK013]|uniref:D-glycero-beta-D-manno-heptose-7-phosphate kinase n=1 Tax=Pedobacter sp. AK013 TaxID=2723071 RepID=UPI00160A6C4B|nr:D-glycero-beta-D-manno-heptose-7-phosphate kinase [Pedobacter sp. AK013]MBB6240091.1 D-beta-D-heptose 7-phosphate kinase/D-beta-D-heptose 1-phosphate adenosyltransferase [Pedobacter sp. AK013]
MNSNGVKILVIGDLMIDHYIYGDCTRISPEAPVPVVEVDREEYTLGGAGNVLKNIVAFNCYGDIVSIVGDDENASLISKELTDYGLLGNGIVKDSTRCTTIKSRVLAVKHQLIRLDRENSSPISVEQEDNVMKVFESKVGLFNIVLISDYNKGLLTPSLLKKIFDSAKKHGIKTVLDPKGLDFSKYLGVNVIKPNRKEAAIATGIAIKDESSLRAACVKLKEITAADDIIITLSEDGIANYSNNELTIIPTKALDVVDVTGAGDTVLASLGLALGAGKSIIEACEFANHAAAIVVNKVGSATATLAEINEKFA